MATLWNSSEPANTTYILAGQQYIRNNWLALDKTVSTDHYPMDDEHQGKHHHATLFEITDPAAVANKGFVYTKDDSGDTELFYRDPSARITQLTENGNIKKGATLVGALNFDGTKADGPHFPGGSAIKNSFNVLSVVKSTNINLINLAITFQTSLPSDYIIIGLQSNGRSIQYASVSSSPLNVGTISGQPFFQILIYGV